MVTQSGNIYHRKTKMNGPNSLAVMRDDMTESERRKLCGYQKNKPTISENESRICLRVITGDHVPSFKNTKRSILDSRTGLQRTLTPGNIKKRMRQLESRMLSALNSLCLTPGNEMDLECQRRLRTALSGLCDDSLMEIPKFEFDTCYVEPGVEGVEIEITPL